MKDNMPITLHDIHDLPIALRGVYEYNDRGYYRLTPGGNVLNQVRSALREGYSKSLKVSAAVALKDWTATMSAATTEERKVLLRLRGEAAIRIAI